MWTSNAPNGSSSIGSRLRNETPGMKRFLGGRFPLLLILLGGTALRLFRLGADSLWYDETGQHLSGRQSPPRIDPPHGR